MWQPEEALREWIRRVDVGEPARMAESRQDELRNVRVLLVAARALARNLAYHRRAKLEASIRQALDEVDRQIEDLR